MKRRFLYDHGILVGGASTRTVKTGDLSIRAQFVPDSINVEKRTVDVCFGTDAPILMGYYDRYYEILSFDGKDCDLSRLNSGAPMLDNHNRWGGASEQPGVVEKAWAKDGKGYATLRFANDKSTQAGVPDGPGEKIFNRVKEGIVRNVSVGYVVTQYEEVDSAGTSSAGVASENKIPTYIARKWQPFEISFAPVPADTGAGVRSQRSEENKSYEVQIIPNQTTEEEMKKRFLYDTGAPGGGGGAAPAPAPAPAPAQRSEPAAPAPAPAPAPAQRSEPAAPTESPELTRSNEIMDIAHIAGLDLAETRTLINGGQTVAQIRAAIIEKKAGAQGPVQVGVNARANDERELAKNTAVEDAILHRAMPHIFKLTDGGREFRGMDLMDMAREFVEGVAVGHSRGKSKMAVAEAALNCGSGRAGMLSSSDFPAILGNVINRVLRNSYESQDSEWRTFSRQVSFKDFRPKTYVQISEGQDLNIIKEGGEYERMKMSDGEMTLQVVKYGRMFAITWETLVNDDLDAFGRVPAAFAEMAARKQADLVWAQILGNPVMADGFNLFSAEHNNLLAAGAINIDNLGTLRATMRKQKGLAGKQRLNLVPKYLLVGPNTEQLALQYTSAAYVPVDQANVNPWKTIYTPITEARFEESPQWIGVADPARIDTLHYGFLEGDGELFTTQREGFEVDGLEIKARMVFGCKVVDYRGFVSNPGA